MNAKQKALICFAIPTMLVMDWFFGIRVTDAVVYSLVALLAGIIFYMVYFKLRDKKP